MGYLKKSLKALLCASVLTVAFAVPTLAASTITPTLSQTAVTDPKTLAAESVTIPQGEKSVVYSVNIPQKDEYTFELSTDKLACKVNIKLYKDAACTQMLSYETMSKQGVESTKLQTKELAKGTYYLELEKVNANASVDLKLRAYYCAFSDQTLSSGQWTTAYDYAKSNESYYKVKVPSTGYLKLEADEGTAKSVEVGLYNKGKKEIGSHLSLKKGRSNYVSLKKGTYYLKAAADDTHRIKYTFTAIKAKDKDISTKKKAATLKAGKKLKGVMPVGESKADFYKITLAKKQKITITMNAKSSDTFDVVVINKKTKKVAATEWFHFSSDKKTQQMKVKALPKGSYYIKIKKNGSKSSSAYYTLSYAKRK